MAFIWFQTSLKRTEQAPLLSPPEVKITTGTCREIKQNNKPFKNYLRNTANFFIFFFFFGVCVVMQQPNFIELCGESSDRKTTLARGYAHNHSSWPISSFLCQTVTRKTEQTLLGIFTSASLAAHCCWQQTCLLAITLVTLTKHTFSSTSLPEQPARDRREGGRETNWPI